MSQFAAETSGGAGNRTRRITPHENASNRSIFVGNDDAKGAAATPEESRTSPPNSHTSGTARGPIHSALFPAMVAFGLTADDLVERASWDRREMTWVYFIQGVDGGPVKIGHARSVATRLDAIQRHSPVRLHVIGCFHAPKMVERALHAFFAASRLHGEWFAPSDELLALIGKWGVL